MEYLQSLKVRASLQAEAALSATEFIPNEKKSGMGKSKACRKTKTNNMLAIGRQKEVVSFISVRPTKYCVVFAI